MTLRGDTTTKNFLFTLNLMYVISMKRAGTITILGAGASADAGYPLAGGFIEPFIESLKEADHKDTEIRKRIEGFILLHGGNINDIPKEGTSHLEWFQEKWDRFEEVHKKTKSLAITKLTENGRPSIKSQVTFDTPTGFPALTPYSTIIEEVTYSKPYLETFFSFYDDYMRPIIFAIENDLRELRIYQDRFRTIRRVAIETVFRELCANNRHKADYLSSLFELQGPTKCGFTIATLNHDVTIEQMASLSKIPIFDGFNSSPTPTSSLPFGWDEQGLVELKNRWEVTAKNSYEFIGFQDAPNEANLLLKLHGSLGWYVMEEGIGDIGFRDELRYNSAYKYFRLPYEKIWTTKKEDVVDQLVRGLATLIDDQYVLTQKAGNVWIHPYLVFARATKTHPDSLYLDIMTTFNQLLDNAENILVVGYSWGDPHINDLILDAVARGANMINVSKSTIQNNAIALWQQRFQTTFSVLRKRLFMFGGGAKNVFEEGKIELPSGESYDIDIIELLKQGLPSDFSLEKTLSVRKN